MGLVSLLYFRILSSGGGYRGGGRPGGPAAAPHARPLHAHAPGFGDDAHQRRSSPEFDPRAAAGGNWADGAPNAANAFGGTAHRIMPCKPIDITS
jgi:hypothetical protein